LSWTQLVRLCYQKNSVPDADGLSDTQFEQLLADPTYHPSTPEGKVCFYDPTGSNGTTVDQAESFDQQKS